MPKTTWTEEEDDFLRRCVTDGRTAAECAELLEAVFGGGRSRSAIIGRTHRLKIAFNSARVGNNKVSRPAAARRQPPATPKPAPARREPAESGRGIVQAVQARAAQRKVELERAHPLQLAVELAVQEAAFAEASRGNKGILFLERDMAKQCAMPMPGWDAAPITEKRVCGLPVLSRRVVMAGIAINQPTSWCFGCTKLAYSQSRKPLDVKALARVDRSMRAA